MIRNFKYFIYILYLYFSHLYYNINKILTYYLYNRNMCKKGLEIGCFETTCDISIDIFILIHC